MFWKRKKETIKPVEPKCNHNWIVKREAYGLWYVSFPLIGVSRARAVMFEHEGMEESPYWQRACIKVCSRCGRVEDSISIAFYQIQVDWDKKDADIEKTDKIYAEWLEKQKDG